MAGVGIAWRGQNQGCKKIIGRGVYQSKIIYRVTSYKLGSKFLQGYKLQVIELQSRIFIAESHRQLWSDVSTRVEK